MDGRGVIDKKNKINDKSIDMSFHDNLFYRKDNVLKNKPLKITIIYLIFGCSWILFSDSFVKMLSLSREVEDVVEILKGWLFVTITSILVFGLLTNLFRQINKLFSELVESYQEKETMEEELRANFEELTEKEKLLSESVERYNLALECSNDIIWEWDIKNKKFILSDKAKDYFDIKNNQIHLEIEDYANKIIKDEDRNIFFKDLKNHLEGNTEFYNSEYRIIKKDGEVNWVLFRGKAIRDSKGNPIKMLGSAQEVTNKKNYEEKLYKMAHFDSLTGLMSKKSFIENINNYLIENRKFAILFLDLDDFKKVNDVFGHDFGDKLLIGVSELLKTEIGEESVVSRVGGDEFLILVDNINESCDIKAICDRLINLFSSQMKVGDKKISISPSIGVVFAPKDGSDADTLIKRADTAMYKAKALGKSTYTFFDKAMIDEIIRKMDIEKELKDSVLDNEFEIYFQPQYNIIENKILGLEALLRWNNPRLGRVSPAEFINIAEESGSISRIGSWVLKRVCEQCKVWEEKNQKFGKVSVNISVIQLQQKGFLDKVKKIIEETEIKTEYLKFEITESVVITNFVNNNEILNELMDMGIEIALDDFGTGYSSINYLRNIPINTLKIDKSFVDNIEESKIDKIILKELIHIANEISIDIIVEGVESKGQLEILEEIGCTQIQGYYFSKPLPLCEVEEMLIKYI